MPRSMAREKVKENSARRLIPYGVVSESVRGLVLELDSSSTSEERYQLLSRAHLVRSAPMEDGGNVRVNEMDVRFSNISSS